MSEQKEKRALRPAKATERLGISVPTLYRYIKHNPEFPRLHKLSERVSFLDEAEVEAFITKRMTA